MNLLSWCKISSFRDFLVFVLLINLQVDILNAIFIAFYTKFV